MNNLRVLITGGNSPTATTFISKHADIFPIAIGVREDLDSNQFGKDRIEKFQVLLNDPFSISSAIEKFKPTHVIHGASQTLRDLQHQPLRSSQIEKFNSALVNAAVSNGCMKIIFTSSASVYGTRRTKNLSEIDSVSPETENGVNKLFIEKHLELLANQYQLNIISLRIFNLFGPGLNNSLINKLVNSTPISPVNFINQNNFVRDYIHVEDLAGILFAAINAVNMGDRYFRLVNAGSGIPTNNTELLKLIRESGSVNIKHARSEFDSSSVADISRLRDELFFVPKISVNEGILRLRSYVA